LEEEQFSRPPKAVVGSVFAARAVLKLFDALRGGHLQLGAGGIVELEDIFALQVYFVEAGCHLRLALDNPVRD